MKSSKRTTTQSQKLKFLCSFNGFFVALHPNSDKFRYQGGDTHLISVDRHHCFNLSCLLSILSLHRSSPISLKYKLPECSTLHPISNDEDFSKMVHAHDWLLSTGNISRLRMYIINNEMNHQRKSVHVGKVNKTVVGVNPNEMAHQKRGLFGCFKFGKIDREVVHSRTRNHRMNVCGSRAAAQNGGKNEFVSESRLLKKERVNGRNVARNGQYFQGNLLSMTVHKADGSLVDCYVNEDGFVSRKNLVKNRLALGKGDVIKDCMQKLVSTILDVSKEIDDANLNDRVKPTNFSPKEVAENDPNLKTHNNDLACRELQIINHTDLEDIRTLGVGAYGTVHYGKWRGSDVAIKRLKSSSSGGLGEDRAVANFWKEARLLAQLNHPNVVAFYGVVVKDGPVTNMAAVTEFMTNGSLKQVLRKKDRTIDRRKRLIIAMDVAFGMEYLHEKNIVHFDLKSHNLLVNMKDPSRPICKIGDFGLSKVKETTSVPGGVRGSVPWMAPELLTTKKNMVTEKVDVYSFGIVMWELLTGEDPYEDMHSDKIIAGVIEGCQRPDIPSWCDPSWRSLMEKCWSSNPSSRPSFSKIAKELRSIAASLNIK